MSTVIKAGQEYKLIKKLTTIDLADHLAEAHKVVGEARAQARAILAQAQRDAAVALPVAQEKGHADGHALGYQAGFQVGQERGLAEAQERFTRQQAELCLALDGIVAEFEARKRDLLIDARHDLLDFAVALARRVVKRIGELDRAAATANLEEALRLVAAKTDVTVRVNPLDAETLRRFAGELTTRPQGLEHVQVLEDAGVSPGGCLVHAGESQADARVETQLEEITRLLLGEEKGLRNED